NVRRSDRGRSSSRPSRWACAIPEARSDPGRGDAACEGRSRNGAARDPRAPGAWVRRRARDCSPAGLASRTDGALAVVRTATPARAPSGAPCDGSRTRWASGGLTNPHRNRGVEIELGSAQARALRPSSYVTHRTEIVEQLLTSAGGATHRVRYASTK